MRNNIGYHTRLDGNDSIKICGGAYGGGLDLETANRLVKAFFTVDVKPSGRAVFVDRGGREVNLYLRVDPERTEIGKDAVITHRKIQAGLEEKLRKEKEFQDGIIEDLMENLSFEEIVRRLQD